MTDSINMLLNACMSAAPGQKECDNALRNIQVRFAIDDPLDFCRNFFSNTIGFYHLLLSIFQHLILEFELHYSSVLAGLKWLILLFLCRL